MDGITFSGAGKRTGHTALLCNALDSLAEQIAVLDLNGDIIAVNRSWRRFAEENGAPAQPENFGLNYLRTCDSANGDCAEEALPAAEGIRRVLAGELAEYRMEYPCHSPSEQRWFLMYATPLLDGGGAIAGGVVSHLPITDRVLAEKRQCESEAQLKTAQRLAHVGSFERDLESGKGEWSEELHRIFGREPRSMEGPSAADFLGHVHPDDRVAVAALFAQGDRDGRSFHTEFRILPRGGGERFVSLICDYDLTPSGRPARRHGALLDMTERHAAEEQLKLLANADPLTGVANRRRLLEILHEERERALRYGQPLCVAMLDLDDFKRVNDVHGHDVGDAMLRHVTALAKASLRSVDTLGRLGGEEFCVLLPQTGLDAGVEATRRILERVRSTPLRTPAGALRQTLSCGLAECCPPPGDSAPAPSVDELLKRADLALYRAKAAGKDRVEPARA